MRLHVKVHGLEFVVPCGDGSQSVKWLGLAVSQRYALAAPHGRCRTREDAHLKQGFFLPANVLKLPTSGGKGNSSQSLPPASRIADVCKDSDTVVVQLQQEVPVNEIGTPQFAPWTVSAFASAGSQQQRNAAASGGAVITMKASFAGSADAKVHGASHANSGARDAQMLRADAKTLTAASGDELKAKKSTVEDGMKEYARAEMLQQVNSGQFQSEMEIEAAFLYDWSRLRIDDLEKDPKEREVIQELLLAHFAHLNAAFMHYAVGSGEMAFGMSGDEFAHFVHECELSHVQRERRALERVVAQSLKHDCLASLHDRGTLSRVGFVHALLRVIQLQAGAAGSGSGSGAKDNNSAAVFRDTVEKSLQNNIAPTVTRLTSGPFRDISHHARTIAVFQDAKPKLLKLYAKYAQLDKPSASTLPQPDQKEPASAVPPMTTTWPQLLSASALKRMLYDAGMFSAGDTVAHDALFASAVEQSFSGARESKQPETQLLVFAEFLEVAARVALAVLDENDLPPRDAIKIALDALRSLPLKSAQAPSRRK